MARRDAPACRSALRDISSIDETLLDVGEGTMTVSAVLPVIRTAQESLTADEGLVDDDVRAKISAIADDFGRMQVVLTDKNLSDVKDMFARLLTDLRALNAACGVVIPNT